MKKKQHVTFCDIVLSAPVREQKSLFKAAPGEIFSFISEIAYNILRGHISLSARYKRLLKRKAKVIRLLSKEQLKTGKRRSLCLKHFDVVLLILKSCINELKERFL